ncbi:reverse transcriptase domain-containing protein [Tanacetum coccineum]
MVEGDEDKTAFFTRKGVFCYQKMLFGLKNAGATYQRLVNKVFNDQIGRNLKVYIDDMVIKTQPEEMLFGFKEGPFLGHLITKQGIKGNPSKVKAITDLKLPRTLKEIQRLNGKVLQGAELNYLQLEKLILALVHAARILRRYFQAHPIWVLIDKPIKQILARPKKSGRVAKWAIELGEHEIEFKGRVGLMLISLERKEYTYALWFEFETMNNKAEYEALLAGLRMAEEMEIKDLAIFIDSQLVINQVKGLFEARQPTIKQYLEKMKEVLKNFDTYSMECI